MNVASTGTFGSALAISWAPASDAGYNYVLSSVKVYPNSASSGTALATYTSGTSANFTMTGTYYSSVNIVATYTRTAVSYNITTNNNGGSGGSVSPSTYTIDDCPTTATLTRPTRSGHDFVGWTIISGPDGASITSGGSGATTDTLNLPSGSYGNVAVTAQWRWTGNTYTITIGDGQGGTTTESYTTSETQTSIPLTRPTIPRGQVFDRWIVTPALSKRVKKMFFGNVPVPFVENDTLNIPANYYGAFTVAATFAAATYRIVFSGYSQGAASTPNSYQMLNAVQTFTLTRPYRAGFKFIEWIASQGTITKGTVTDTLTIEANAVGDITLQAVLERGETGVLNIRPTRFVRQVTTASLQDKTNFVSLMQTMLLGLQNADWKKVFAPLANVGMPEHDFEKGPYLDDKYDAYKMCGLYDSSTQKYYPFAGCVAYRFKVPESYRGHYNATTCFLKTITLTATRDRFLKMGYNVHVVASDSDTPSANWSVIHGDADASGTDVTIIRESGIADQSSVTYLTDAMPLSTPLTVDTIDKAQVISQKNYVYVYLTLADYTDRWTRYSSSEARLYAIEGAAALTATDVLFNFTDTAGIITPDEEPVDPDDTGTGGDNRKLLKRIIYGTAGFVGAAAITVGAIWYGGKDGDGDLIPDAWENSFAVLSAISDPSERAQYAAVGDYMAYADIESGLIVASNKVTGVCRPYAYDSMAYPYISVGATLTNVEAKTAFPYGETLGIGTNVTLGTQYVVEGYARKRSFRLVHFQVYDRYGYEQDVATGRGTRHTKAFTALDKYLVARFLMEHGIGPGETNATKNAVSPLPYTTLVPGVLDYDGDSINDGLELYMMFGPKSHALSSDHLSAWRRSDGTSDYDNDGLTAAQELGADVAQLNPWSFITNPGSMIDTYAYIYNVRSTEDAASDEDGDGLSNYSEYLISKVFGFMELDPYQPYTSNGSVPDYFRKQGELYYGEIFQDHDRVNDQWEQKYSEWANAAVYDPDRDDDKDGWGNYDEYKAGTHPGKQTVVGIDGLIYDAMPIPICKMTLTYAGTQRTAGPIVVVAESEDGKDFVKWNLGGVPTNKTASAAITENSRYVGMNPGTEKDYHFGKGVIINGTFKAKFKVLNYEIGHIDDEKFVMEKYGDPEKSEWTDEIVDKNGKLYDTRKNEEVGTIDYEHGLVTVDFSKSVLNEYAVIESVSTKTNVVVNGVTNEVENVNLTRMNLAESHVNFMWKERAVQLDASSVKYFSVADANSDGTHNWLKKNPYKFSAFIDNDGNGTYTAGEPYGCAVGVTPGYDKCEFTVGLTDTYSITPRFGVYNSTRNDRGTTFDESIKMLLSDRSKQQDAYEAAKVGADTQIADTISNQVEQVEYVDATKDKLHVRIVRFGMNDIFAYLLTVGYGGGYQNKPECLVKNIYLPKKDNNITEKLFYDDGEYDLDWTRLKDEVIDNNAVISGVGNVTNVTYLAVLDGGKGHEYWILGSYDTNTVIRCLATPIERRFEKTKHAPVALNTGICYSARPTFRWSLPNEEEYAKKYGTSYTAFNLEIYDEDDVKVYESGTRRAPVQDANGSFSWTADLSVGDLTKLGKRFLSTGNYTWRVAMYNAKFKPGTNDKWSNAQTFSMAVNSTQDINAFGYSSIDVAVRYAGNTNVLYYLNKNVDYTNLSTTNAKIRVQAFATADFAGDPLSEAVVTTNVNNFTDAALPNVRLVGLPATGTYFLRAYIDSNGNHMLDDWESWGEAKEGVTLTTSTVTAPVVGVWIEDSDIDGDWMPDAYEYVVYNRIDMYGAYVSGNNATIFGSAELSAASNRVASISTSMEGSSLVIFENRNWTKNVLDWGDNNSTITFADINNAVMREAAMRQTYVRIDDATISDSGVVTFTTDKGRTAHEVVDPKYYVVNPQTHNATVGFKVQRRDNLAEQNWTTVGTFSTTVSVNDTSKTYSTGLSVDKTHYIYRVKLD